MTRKIKVLIIDDSAVVRQTLESILSSDPAIEVIGTAADPYFAARKIAKDVPDVITLDVEMPRMDGLIFLQKLMHQHPLPVVMCSSLTEKGCETTLKALEYGAVEIITKPRIGTRQFLEDARITLCDTVKAAAQSRVKSPRPSSRSSKKLTADAVIPPPRPNAMLRTTERVVVIGASTGGTEALRKFLMSFEKDCPGMVIVQHMPEHFTRAFAERLNDTCLIEITEAADKDRVLPGQALIAPGNRHILLKRSGTHYHVEVVDGPLVCRHKPSVDVLFRSAARYAGPNAIGVIMTGMGDDGAKGMLEMKNAGSTNIAQDEASCVVFGMPQEAIKHGAVDKVLPLEKIPRHILSLL
jgi:two-component system chemotaxis response regulator CheB